MNKFRKKIRIILWTALLGVVFWLLWMKVVPNGKVVYVETISKDSDAIGELGPEERVKRGREKWNIVGNPIYFSLRPPRSFEKAEVSVEYRNPDQLPVIEAGILADGKLWRYRTKPLENRLIDEISASWSLIKEKGLMLLQKDPEYESLRDFLAEPPSADKVAVYNYDLDMEYRPEEERKTEEEVRAGGIRGAWQLFTYVNKGEVLDIDLEFADINENDDPDDIELFLYYKGDVIQTRSIEDKEPEKNRDRIKTGFELSGMPQGVYKLELRANRDIISNNIKTKQNKMSFLAGVEMVADKGGDDLFTNSRQVQVATGDPAALQKLKIAEFGSPADNFVDIVDVDQTYKQFESKKLPEISRIILEKGGLKITGDGVFAFTPKALMDPRLKRADGSLDIKERGLEYIIAEYEPPKNKGYWSLAKAEFDLRSAYQENGKYGLMISVPGLRADDDLKDGLEIRKIRIKLTGRSLWDKIKGIFYK